MVNEKNFVENGVVNSSLKLLNSGELDALNLKEFYTDYRGSLRAKSVASNTMIGGRLGGSIVFTPTGIGVNYVLNFHLKQKMGYSDRNTQLAAGDNPRAYEVKRKSISVDKQLISTDEILNWMEYSSKVGSIEGALSESSKILLDDANEYFEKLHWGATINSAVQSVADNPTRTYQLVNVAGLSDADFKDRVKADIDGLSDMDLSGIPTEYHSEIMPDDLCQIWKSVYATKLLSDAGDGLRYTLEEQGKGIKALKGIYHDVALYTTGLISKLPEGGTEHNDVKGILMVRKSQMTLWSYFGIEIKDARDSSSNLTIVAEAAMGSGSVDESVIIAYYHTVAPTTAELSKTFTNLTATDNGTTIIKTEAKAKIKDKTEKIDKSDEADIDEKLDL